MLHKCCFIYSVSSEFPVYGSGIFPVYYSQGGRIEIVRLIWGVNSLYRLTPNHTRVRLTASASKMARYLTEYGQKFGDRVGHMIGKRGSSQ